MRPPKVTFIAPREVGRVTSDPDTRETASFRVWLSSRGAMKATFGTLTRPPYRDRLVRAGVPVLQIDPARMTSV